MAGAGRAGVFDLEQGPLAVQARCRSAPRLGGRTGASRRDSSSTFLVRGVNGIGPVTGIRPLADDLTDLRLQDPNRYWRVLVP